ncbi:MAG: ABC transporter ATP-binding protein [Sphaerochaetaceae bacterium]|jgi:putative ABC transport system ATP-binding protein
MIKVEKVSRNYKTGESIVRALKQVSLEIQDGEFLSIAGPSGSGKTTLLNLIGCIDAIDDGEICINDQKISTMSKEEKTSFRRQNVGFIFQTYNLIPVLSAYENVSFVLSLLNVPKAEVRQRTYEMLQEVGLQGMENRRPSQLSGGQQQRIAIARALVKRPQLILADEPTANLDSKTGEEILKLMRQMNEKFGTTFIFSTHDKMVMEYASRLVQLHDGSIASDERRQ